MRTPIMKAIYLFWFVVFVIYIVICFIFQYHKERSWRAFVTRSYRICVSNDLKKYGTNG